MKREIFHVGFPRLNNISASFLCHYPDRTGETVAKIRIGHYEIFRNGNPDAGLPRCDSLIQSRGIRNNVKTQLTCQAWVYRKRWRRIDPTVNTGELKSGKCRVCVIDHTFPPKIASFFKGPVEFPAAQVCAPGSDIWIGVYIRCMSLMRGWLVEKGCARLLLPLASEWGMTEMNRSRIQKLDVRWRVLFVRIQITVHVGKMPTIRMSCVIFSSCILKKKMYSHEISLRKICSFKSEILRVSDHKRLKSSNCKLLALVVIGVSFFRVSFVSFRDFSSLKRLQ